MPKITEISFKNYRAFWGDDNRIKIDGKNALIYGENGSGKSSFYQGLKEFFRASDVTWEIEQPPTHLKAANPNEYEVKVVFDNDFDHPIIFSGRTIKEEKIEQTFLLNSFLSYKEMLRTHFLEVKDLFEEKKVTFEEKLFTLLTQTLLNKHEIGDLTVEKTLQEIWRLRKSRKGEDKDRIQELFDNFNVLFPKEIEKISEQCEKLLEYFNKDLKIKLEPQTFTLEKGKVLGSIKLKVGYLDEEDVNHLEILNEARLSALAISICLAAIVTNPTVKKANYKILFLDDVFIGLDTSNRLPLLNILQKFEVEEPVFDENGKQVIDEGNLKFKQVNFFKDFQIFLTTYDRYWFELAQTKLGKSWMTAEMYVGEEKDGGKKLFEKPVIVQDQLEPLDKAIKFFEAFDYYSAGNYLRKALEKELENLIDKTYLIETKDLEGTISKLFTYYDECDCKELISEELRTQLKMFKDSVLNPSSHYDLESPLYRAEIEAAIEMIKNLKQLPKIERMPIGYRKSSLFYQNDEKEYKAEYILRGEVYAVKTEGNPTKIIDANHSMITWSLKNQDFVKKDGGAYSEEETTAIKETVIKLTKRAERIKNFLDLEDAPDWKGFTDRDGKTLIQLAEEV